MAEAESLIVQLIFWSDDNVVLQVCGVQALKKLSQHYVTPYKPSLVRGTMEEVQQRISTLRLQLQEAESELERLQEGK